MNSFENNNNGINSNVQAEQLDGKQINWIIQT